MANSTYLGRKRAGICVRCGIEKAQPDRTYCKRCAIAHSKYVLSGYSTLAAKKAQKSRVKKGDGYLSNSLIQKERLERGECVLCGKKTRCAWACDDVYSV